AGLVHFEHASSDGECVGKADLLDVRMLDFADKLPFEPALELVATFTADCQDLDLFAVALERQNLLSCQTHDIGVEASAEPPIGCRHDHEMDVVATVAR